MPFSSPIQYIMPPFWANALYKQIVILGDNFWKGFVQISSTNPLINQYLSIPLWGALLIIIGILLVTTIIGIYLFQKKTIALTSFYFFVRK